ncbi:MAG: hypothetical protein CMF72_10020 [Mameliella sp.]|nr:hypothetical protein [Mameliella sp.]
MTPAHMERGPGRPRSFDNVAALETAMRCFWSRGCARATMGVLRREMFVPRANLYAHFGDKNGLFLLAIDHFARSRSAKALAHLTGQGDAFAEIAGFFEAAITLVSDCLASCPKPQLLITGSKRCWRAKRINWISDWRTAFGSWTATCRKRIFARGPVFWPPRCAGWRSAPDRAPRRIKCGRQQAWPRV